MGAIFGLKAGGGYLVIRGIALSCVAVFRGCKRDCAIITGKNGTLRELHFCMFLFYL